jgi:hypothetical protein
MPETFLPGNAVTTDDIGLIIIALVAMILALLGII